MVRSKTKYELIADERARRVTCTKRKACLQKKLHELKVLCGIEGCAIVCDERAEPEAWPSPSEAFRVIQKFKALPEHVQTNNMVDQERFFEHHLARVNKNLVKANTKARSLEIELKVDKCLNQGYLDVTDPNDLEEMKSLLARRISIVDDRIASMAPSTSGVAASMNEPGRGKGKEPL